MSTLFVMLSLIACGATAAIGAFGMRFYIERNRIIAEREDPRDTKIRELQAAVKLARKDLVLTRNSMTETTDHLKLAHERIDELIEQRDFSREKFNSCEALLKKEIGDRELLQEKLSVAKTQVENLKERNQELELQIRHSNEGEMLSPSFHESDHESDELEEETVTQVSTPEFVDDGSPSLIQSLTGELDRWKHHCHVLGNELKHQREQIGQNGAIPVTESFPGVDELTDIRGIGKVMARKLHTLGIFRFQEIIDLDGDDLMRARSVIPDIERRMHRDDWVSQAQQLCQRKIESPG